MRKLVTMDSTSIALGSNGSGALDSLLYVTIILFVLSVITEKITQLVRCYPRQFQFIGIFTILWFYYLLLYSFIKASGTTQDLQATDYTVLIIVNSVLLMLFLLILPYFKRYGKNIGWLAQKAALFQNINKNTPVNDVSKSRDITLLSFIIGFIIAYLFNANLLELFANPKR